MKRLLALLLCLALLLPVFSLAEEDEEDWDLDDLDVEEVDLGEDEDEEEEDPIGSEDDEDYDLSAYPDDDQDTVINYDELEINPNCPDDVINILLIGVDTRGNEDRNNKSKLLRDQLSKDGKLNPYAKRNDVTIILSINLLDGTVKLTSLARDLLVDIPGKSASAPINESFSYRHSKNGSYIGSEDVPQRTIRTVNRNFQLNIQHYFAINFYGVEEIIEYFGGVDVELTKAEAKAINNYIKKNKNKMKNTYDEHSADRVALKAVDGVQHLDGLQGLVLARSRHVSGSNGTDVARTGRTRRLLQALFHQVAEKLESKEYDLLNLVPELTQYLISDMSMQEILNLAMKVWPIVRDSDMLSDMSSITALMEEKQIPGESTKGDLGWTYKNEKVKLYNFQAVTEDLHDFIFGAYYPAD